MIFRARLLVSVALLSVAVLAACGSSDSTPPSQEVPDVGDDGDDGGAGQTSAAGHAPTMTAGSGGSLVASGGAGGSDASGGSGGSAPTAGSGGKTTSGGSSGSTTSAGSGGTTTSGGSGGSTTSGGSAGAPVGDDCTPDIYEPDEDYDDAHAVTDLDDGNQDGATVSATFSAETDVDAYAYHGTDAVNLAHSGVYARIDTNPANHFKLCVYVLCDSGSFDGAITCDGAAQLVDGPDGGVATKGCCVEDAALTYSIDCSTDDESSTVTMIASNTSNFCYDYSLSYDFFHGSL